MLLLEFAYRKKTKIKKSCPIGYPCRNTCINRNYFCKQPLKGQGKSYADWLRNNGLVRAQKRNESKQEILKLEDKIRTQRFESAAVFDSQGNQLFLKNGNLNRVSFHPSEIKVMKDAILTHNHPEGWEHPTTSLLRKGNSFSDSDIFTAVTTNLAEIRAVSPGYRHSLVRPKNGWAKNTMDIVREAIYTTIAENLASIEHATTPQEEDKSLELAAAEHWHKIVTIIARKMGAKYTRTKHEKQS